MRKIAVLLLSTVALVACEVEAPVEDGHRALVRAVDVRRDRLRHQLSFHGVLQPVTRARLAFQSPGVLESRPVRLGQYVRAGEMLATLNNPELGPAQRAAAARLQETLSRRDQAQRDLQRLRSLAATGAVGEEQVEQKAAELASLQAAVARAEADLTGTRQRLEDATLLAPFDGVISELSVEPGEFVSAGQQVMTIGGLDKVEVRVLLPASLVNELAVGDPLEVRIPQLDKLSLSGKLTELSAIGEVETGLFPVVVEIQADRASPVLRAGMQAEVVVNYADVEGLVVPLRAIVDPVGGDPKVFLVSDGRARQHAVRILAIASGEVAIDLMSGAVGADGKRVVVAGHRSLTDGQEVEVIQ